MSERIQGKRRLDSAVDWLATVVVAALMAAALALLAEGIVLLIGALNGDVAWLRSWVDAKFALLQQWLTGLPGLGWVPSGILGLQELLPLGGMARDLFALIITFYPLCLFPAKRAGPALMARFDNETLRVAPGADFGMRWAGPLGDHQKTAWSWLQHWCFDGSGSGKSPLLRPWVMPSMKHPFSVAMLVGANGTGKSHLAEAFSRDLDGSARLTALPREWARLRLRSRMKLQSWLWWRARQQSDPWDCGYLVEDSAARERLSQFLPRRATLLIADQLQPASLMDCIKKLNARRVEFRHPVRLLVIDVILPAALGLNWNAGKGLWRTGEEDLGEVPVMNLSPVRFRVPEFRALVRAQYAEADLGRQWAGPLDDHQKIAWSWLHHWCFDESGSGHSVLPRPWTMPHVGPPFSVAMLVGDNDKGKSRLVKAFSRHLDGSDRCTVPPGDWTQLRLRLHVKLKNWLWWRTCQRTAPWDCSYIVEDPATRARLSQFLPCRATLMIADGLTPASLMECITTLNVRRQDFRHPVRLLVIDVTVPEALGLNWDASAKFWHTTKVQELGEVHVINLSPAQFHVPEIRSRVDTQQIDASGQYLHLPGLDSVWAPLVDALEGQPILLTETIRMVRDQYLKFESMLVAEDLFDKTVQRQVERAHSPLLPVDVLGKRRELLRERVLSARTEHRENVLRSDLGSTGGDVDKVFEAILITSVANGGSELRLARLLGWDIQHRMAIRVSALLGVPYTQDWVPALKPAVIVDEMLRRYFDAKRDVDLSEGTRQRVVLMMRRAWLLNPAGTLRTVGRWQQRLRRDAFIHALLQLPTLAEFERSHKVNPDTRVEIVRAFFELAVVNQGDLQLAVLAMGLLDEDELAAAEPELSALVMRPDAWGLPALVLWLLLVRRSWPNLHTMLASEAVAFGCTLIQRFQHLLRQSVVCTVPMTSLLRQLLDEAFLAILPICGQIAKPCAGAPSFQALVNALWNNSRCYYSGEGAGGQASRLRDQLVKNVAVQLAAGDSRPIGEPVPWLYAVMKAIAATTRLDVSAPPLQGWLVDEYTTEDGLSFTWALARSLASVAFAHKDSNAAVTEAAAERVAAIASKFPAHEGIQYASAQAWRFLASAHWESNAAATKAAAERVASIASAFPKHEGIQYESAEAWRDLVSAHWNSNIAAAEAAAERVAAIASKFPEHEGIQHASAVSLQRLAWANRHDNAAATEAAAERVAAIASKFPAHISIQNQSAVAWSAVISDVAAERVASIALAFPKHEDIQLASAVAWQSLAWAHQDCNAAATEGAVWRVEAIALAFPRHEGIQHVRALVWRELSWAYRGSNASATRAAARCVAAIASKFPTHEGIQYESAIAWQCLASAHQDSNAAATEAAVWRVEAIAMAFPGHEGIQFENAKSWRHLAWAHQDSNAVATEAAVWRVAAIALAFPGHESIYNESAQAWRCLAWAHKDSNAVATETSAVCAAAIASVFTVHEGIHSESAEAWRCLVWAHKNHNVAATHAAAERVAAIAMKFPANEGIQHLSAVAWRFLVESAVKFNNEGGIALALARLDDLCHERDGEMVWKGYPVSGRILAQREFARTAVKSWRQLRNGGFDIDAVQE